MKARVFAYDPRLQEDYSILNHTTKKTFSSMKYGFFVLEGVGELDWMVHLYFLNRCIEATSKKLFFMVDPWEPGARELRKAVEQKLGALIEFERSLCGYAPIDSDVLGWLLELRRYCGGDNTGRWCIGGCLAEFTPPTRIGFWKGQLWDVALVLEQPEKIGCVLSLDEMQQSLFVTRLFDGIDGLLCHSPAAHLFSA